MTTALLASRRSPRVRGGLILAGLLGAAGLAAETLHVTDALSLDVSYLYDRWLYGAIFAGAAAVCALRAWRVPAERSAWGVFAAGLGSSLVGWLLLWLVDLGQHPQPYPGWSDAFWLLGYALNCCGLILLLRARVRHWRRAMWLDGAIGALALAAVSAGAVFGPVVASTGGSAAAVITNLAYPSADLLVLVMVVGGLALGGWRLDPSWLLIGAAFAAAVVADSIYLYESASGTWTQGTLLDVAWLLNPVLIAAAAWVPGRGPRREATSGPAALLVPGLFTVLAIGVLVHGARMDETFSLPATLLATAALIASYARCWLTFRHMRVLTERHDRAVDAAFTDHLTGLRNNRAFHEDLGREVELASHSRPLALLLIDLVGLKATNDNLGHQAGDERLQLLARNLTSILRRGDRAYRVGGDEFAVVLPGVSAWDAFALAERLQRGLSGGFASVAPAVSVGVAEASERIGKDRLIRRADAALIEAKHSHRKAVLYSEGLERTLEPAPEERRLHTKTLATALARAVDAKDAYTRSHCETVSELCVLIAKELGLERPRIDKLRLAGLLHDVGKIGVPDTILRKPGPLTPEEFAVMREHSELGHSIVSGAGLDEEAAWILHHHERPDGRGYPDGLIGEEIPLESRIILVADAFEAITSDRPYRIGRPEHRALEELRRHAGKQFDPDCVAALEAALGYSSVESALPMSLAASNSQSG